MLGTSDVSRAAPAERVGSPQACRPIGSNARRGTRPTNNPGGGSFECPGAFRCENPKRAVPFVVRLAGRSGRGQAEADRNSEAPVGASRKADYRQARGRSPGETRTRFPPADPRRAKTQGSIQRSAH